MSDNALRHVLAFLGTLIAALIFFVGYSAGVHGWWFVIITVALVYPIVYSLIKE